MVGEKDGSDDVGSLVGVGVGAQVRPNSQQTCKHNPRLVDSQQWPKEANVLHTKFCEVSSVVWSPPFPFGQTTSAFTVTWN